jgi:DNA primase
MSDILQAVIPYLGDPVGSSSRGNYKFKCPFHKGGEESSPSFYLHGEEGVSFCHACNQGWSLLSLLKDLGAGRKTLTNAAELLGPPKKKSVKSILRKNLIEVPALPEELLAIFELCPVELIEEGFEKLVLQVLEVGYDEAHTRITYPIRDHKGRLVGVSGRNEDGYGPKYKIYTTELEAFLDGYKGRDLEKSWFIWNLHNIYPDYFLGDCEEPIIVVEGFKACMWCIQHGFLKTVAIMGSYMSNEQARLLGRMGVDVMIFLDQNSAGIAGTKRSYDALKKYCGVKEVRYPRNGNLQPDDLEEDELIRAISNAQYMYRRRI